MREGGVNAGPLRKKRNFFGHLFFTKKEKKDRMATKLEGEELFLRLPLGVAGSAYIL